MPVAASLGWPAINSPRPKRAGRSASASVRRAMRACRLLALSQWSRSFTKRTGPGAASQNATSTAAVSRQSTPCAKKTEASSSPTSSEKQLEVVLPRMTGQSRTMSRTDSPSTLSPSVSRMDHSSGSDGNPDVTEKTIQSP
eukprot:scaffold250031_cov49-Tisochrysis_lutea.AAC.4